MLILTGHFMSRKRLTCATCSPQTAIWLCPILHTERSESSLSPISRPSLLQLSPAAPIAPRLISTRRALDSAMTQIHPEKGKRMELSNALEKESRHTDDIITSIRIMILTSLYLSVCLSVSVCVIVCLIFFVRPLIRKTLF